jgi:5,10-methylenetetrahydromethanopterin reductase
LSGAAEIYLHGFPIPGRTVELAMQAEQWGFDGLLLADSENLVGDPYVELTLASRATERLRLGPAVTNPLTRHPAVTAAALATLQVESGGRAVAVFGRGDSAVLQLGLRPATTAQLEQGLTQLQGFLSGEEVDLGEGRQARMAWVAALHPTKVPIDVAATGPQTIALGAGLAERVTFTVGADPRRVSWAVEEARRAAGGRGGVSLGAFVNFAVNSDMDVARGLVRGSVAIFAHFVSEGPLGVLPEEDRQVVQRLGAAYEERSHGLSTAAHATLLPDGFVDRFAVVGSAEQCIERLRGLLELGLERLIMVPGSRDADPALVAESNARFASEVLPALRS